MEELYRLIPDKYVAPIRSRLFYERISEVRIINGAPVRICYDGAYYFLCKSGITKDKSCAFVAEKNEAESVVMRACEHSLYTVTDTIKRGFVSVAGGLRIGVCGSGVMDGGELTAVKDFSSVNIRLPHEVTDCAAGLFAKVISGGSIKNTLIISPPAAGKTTMLRDLCRLVSNHGYCVLLCDEKYEIAAVSGGQPTLDVGCCTDVISGVDKRRVFETGVAHMRPDVIMADELMGNDLNMIVRASTCGIAVVATVHAYDYDDMLKKPYFKQAVENKVFTVFVTLSGAPRRTVTVREGDGHER
ncbi:MAG: Flp pilus assembly complex ATPase component TadA [Clostridiales bacterium]|nr:Flp pilus assembly complex ATPase component TadA [Clostridiales bacterium]